MCMRVLRAVPGMLPRMPIWFWLVSVSHTLTVAHGSARGAADGVAEGRRREDRGREEDQERAAHVTASTAERCAGCGVCARTDRL